MALLFFNEGRDSDFTFPLTALCTRTVSTPSCPQTLGLISYSFVHWSIGGGGLSNLTWLQARANLWSTCFYVAADLVQADDGLAFFDSTEGCCVNKF